MIKYLPVILLLCSLHLYAQPVEITCFDLFPGDQSSFPRYLSSSNGKMIFSAGDTATGLELWVSDGTIDGTHVLKDIKPGKNGSNPSFITVASNKAFFLASEKNSSTRLWTSDGTTAGTMPIRNVDTNSQYSAVNNQFMTLNNHILIFAVDNSGKRSLWTSDGTQSGTFQIISFTNEDVFRIVSFAVYRSKIVFFACSLSGAGQLWVTDGTKAGTKKIYDFYSCNDAIINVCNDKLYFNATDLAHGEEIWISDGTTAGTHLIKDLYTGEQNGFIRPSIYSYKNNCYFYGTNGSYMGLYATDGTSAGTKFIANTSAIFGSENCIIYNNRMYFTGDSSALYVSDGTTQGTYPIRDTASRFFQSSILIEYKNNLYIKARVKNRYGLYRISKADSVEQLIAGPDRTFGTVYNKFFLYNSTLWLTDMLDSASGDELWRIYDSTEISKPASIVTIYPNPNHGSFTISTADSNFIGRIHICDVAGREVYYNNHVSGSIINVTIPGAAAGVYFLTMQDISDPKTSRNISAYKIVVW